MVTSEAPVRLTLPADPRPRVDVGLPFRRMNASWLALDFVNTVPGWLPSAERRAGRDWADRTAGERLIVYDDLILWSRLAGVLRDGSTRHLRRAAARDPGAAAAVVRRAHALRVALYRLFRAISRGWSPLAEDLDTFNRELRRLRDGEVLVHSPAGFQLEWAGAHELQALLWPPLRSALALLLQPDLAARIGQCGGDGCNWLFVDVGRGRTRQWCDIRDCGNLAKVRAYRSRKTDHDVRRR